MAKYKKNGQKILQLEKNYLKIKKDRDEVKITYPELYV